MDYSKINPSSDANSKTETLSIRKLTESEAKDLLGVIWLQDNEATKALPLFGPHAQASWTVAAMGNLTPLAHKLTLGRLKWVLSTALPLNPGFQLFVNGSRLESSKQNLKPLNSWLIGVEDKVAEREKIELSQVPLGIKLGSLGLVTGVCSIFEDTLVAGKAEHWGRSHGIFVMVRGRLVNIDDALFGLPALSHGPFARFRMEVFADGLDVDLRSTRETVMESDSVSVLRDYILAKFNEARSWYNTWLAQKDFEARISTRISATPQSLSRKPLVNAIRNVLEGTSNEMYLTKVPLGLKPDEKKDLIARLEEDLESDNGLIKEVKFEPLGMEVGIALYDVKEGCVRVNQLHPFYANYVEHYLNSEPFELIAVTEVLTEAYLLEEGIASDTVTGILKRRDRFMRELVYSRQLAAPVVAEYIRGAVANPSGLEKAVEAGLSSIGFEVSPIGGKGEPDGVALARLGIRAGSVERSDFKITYDAKSTAKEKVQAHTVGSGTLVRHRNSYGAQYSLVVAVDFAGAHDPKSAIVVEAKEQGITLMTADDFARLVLVAATRQLGFSKLRDLFETCRGPEDARAWIDLVLGEAIDIGPLPQILEATWALQQSLLDPVKFAVIAHKIQTDNIGSKPYREAEIKEWLQSLRRLAGGYISIDGDVVCLEAPPMRIMHEIRVVSAKLPEQFRLQSMVTALIGQKQAKTD